MAVAKPPPAKARSSGRAHHAYRPQWPARPTGRSVPELKAYVCGTAHGASGPSSPIGTGTTSLGEIASLPRDCVDGFVRGSLAAASWAPWEVGVCEMGYVGVRQGLGASSASPDVFTSVVKE